MGLFDRIKQKRAEKRKAKQTEPEQPKVTYDVNAPIETYTEEQIIARIQDEVGAVYEYGHLIIGDSKERQLAYDHKGFYSDLSVGFFLNDFYKQAITLKAKKLLLQSYREKAKSCTQTITKAGFENDWENILTFIEDLVTKAKKETKRKEQNAEEMKKIEALFENNDGTIV